MYNDEARISTENSFDSHYYCNHCCFVLKHFRHKCTLCPEYDLCSWCVKAGIHNEHQFEYLDIVTSEDSPALVRKFYLFFCFSGMVLQFFFHLIDLGTGRDSDMG